MGKIDKMIEKIAPSSQFHPTIMININSENFIVRAIDCSQLSYREMVVINTVVNQRVFAAITPLVIQSYNAVNGEHYE